MDNNQLDNYFKENSHRFDEQPGTDLWAKIENELDAPMPNQGGKGSFFSRKWVWLVAGIVVSVLIAVNYIPSENNSWVAVPKPEIPHEEYEKQNVSEGIREQPADTTKTKKVVQKPAKLVKVINNAAATRHLAPNRITDTVIPDLMPDVEVTKIKPVPEPKKVKISVQESAKRTVLTIREKISQQKFDSIVTASLAQYKDKAGMQLIVKGMQGQIYRYTFAKKGERQYLMDTIKTQPKNRLDVTTTVKTIKDSVTIESAVFKPKYDSLTETYYVQYKGKPVAVQQDPVYTAQLTVQPEFPGGVTQLNNFIYKNFRYPKTSKEYYVEIKISFIIEINGSISNIKVLNNTGFGLDKEALRVLKLLTTKWKPGEVNGKPVRTAYFIPITISNMP